MSTDYPSKFTKEYHDELVDIICKDPLGRQALIDAEVINEDGTEHESTTEIFKFLKERGIIKPD